MYLIIISFLETRISENNTVLYTERERGRGERERERGEEREREREERERGRERERVSSLTFPSLSKTLLIQISYFRLGKN